MDNQLEVLELSMEQSKKMIARKDALETLLRNKDFQTIMTEGYFEREACRLVGIKADPNMQTEESQKEIIKQIDAIGSVRQYFNVIRMMGQQAERAIAADEETHAELLAEA